MHCPCGAKWKAGCNNLGERVQSLFIRYGTGAIVMGGDKNRLMVDSKVIVAQFAVPTDVGTVRGEPRMTP